LGEGEGLGVRFCILLNPHSLVGYWRLGRIAIDEDHQRQVIDFSVNKNDGIVLAV
jgi:hypothetical protein